MNASTTMIVTTTVASDPVTPAAHNAATANEKRPSTLRGCSWGRHSNAPGLGAVRSQTRPFKQRPMGAPQNIRLDNPKE
jgi:hypothetical protein